MTLTYQDLSPEERRKYGFVKLSKAEIKLIRSMNPAPATDKPDLLRKKNEKTGAQ